MIKKYYTNARFGAIYEAVDLQQKVTGESNKIYQVKIQRDLAINQKEYTILKLLNQNYDQKLLNQNYDQKLDNKRLFPKVYIGGEFIIKCQRNASHAATDQMYNLTNRQSFIITQTFGTSLQRYMDK